MQFFSLTATSTLNWNPSVEIALFFSLAGAIAVPASASFKPLVQRIGLMRLGVGSHVMRGVTVLIMGAAVRYVAASQALIGTFKGVALVMSAALFTTFFNTIYMAFTSIAVLV
jgi:hypothetical protein